MNPTNHLDLEAILWLEGWLNRFPGAMLIIAHDRAFLDSTATSVMLWQAMAASCKGNYSAFEHQRRRVGTPAGHGSKTPSSGAAHSAVCGPLSRQGQQSQASTGRIKALERMQTQAALHVDSDYRVNFSNPKKVSNPLFSFRDLVLGYEDNKVLHRVSQTILPGARIGVLGANGLANRHCSRLWLATFGPSPVRWKKVNTRISATSHNISWNLWIPAIAPTKPLSKFIPMTPQQCRDYLGGWGFSLQMIERPISSLSGGEKADWCCHYWLPNSRRFWCWMNRLTTSI